MLVEQRTQIVQQFKQFCMILGEVVGEKVKKIPHLTKTLQWRTLCHRPVVQV